MATKQSIRRRIESLGGSFEDNDYSVDLDAPPGYVWAATGGGTLVQRYANHCESWTPQAMAELIERASMGLRKCTPEEVAAIEYERDEPWAAGPDAAETLPW